MAAYHVFVDGSADGTAAGLEQLAEAVAAHYGLPVADVRVRIASGRFRVKGNCDRATADLYVRDLTRLGATCSVEEASPANASKTPLPFPAVTAPARPSQSALPPRQTAPPAVARTMSGSKEYQSGLSAAFSSSNPQIGSLGALDDGALLKLSSVDGTEDGGPSAPSAPSAASGAAFGPPDAGAGTRSASNGAPVAAAAQPARPGPARAAGATPAPPRDEPLDMFAPPDAEAASLQVDLAPDEVERAAKRRVSPPPEPEAAAGEPPPRVSRSSLQPPNEPGSRHARASQPALTGATGATGAASHARPGLGDPRVRFALGVVLAIVLGFVPAHLVARMREHSEFTAIDDKVIAIRARRGHPRGLCRARQAPREPARA